MKYSKNKSALFLVLIAYWHKETRYPINDFLNYNDLIQDWGFTETTLNRAIKVLIELDLLNTKAFSKYKSIMIKTSALTSNSKNYITIKSIEDLQILTIYGMYALVNQKQLDYAYNQPMQIHQSTKDKIINALAKLQKDANTNSISQTKQAIENYIHISNNFLIGSQYQIRKSLNQLLENNPNYQFSHLKLFDTKKRCFYTLRVLIKQLIEDNQVQLTEREWEIYDEVKAEAEEELKYVVPERGMKSISEVMNCYLAKLDAINTVAHNAIKRYRKENNSIDASACIKIKSSN